MTTCCLCPQDPYERKFFQETQAIIRCHSGAFKEYRSSYKMAVTVSFIAIGTILLLGGLWLAISTRTFGINGVQENLGFVNPYLTMTIGGVSLGIGLLPMISIPIKYNQFKNKTRKEIADLVKKNAGFPLLVKGNLKQTEKNYCLILSPAQHLNPLSNSPQWILRRQKIIECFATKKLYNERTKKLTLH